LTINLFIPDSYSFVLVGFYPPGCKKIQTGQYHLLVGKRLALQYLYVSSLTVTRKNRPDVSPDMVFVLLFDQQFKNNSVDISSFFYKKL